MNSKTKFDFISFDKRIVETNIKRHKVSEKDYQKNIKALQDEGQNVDEHPVFQENEESSDFVET